MVLPRKGLDVTSNVAERRCNSFVHFCKSATHFPNGSQNSNEHLRRCLQPFQTAIYERQEGGEPCCCEGKIQTQNVKPFIPRKIPPKCLVITAPTTKYLPSSPLLFLLLHHTSDINITMIRILLPPGKDSYTRMCGFFFIKKFIAIRSNSKYFDPIFTRNS